MALTTLPYPNLDFTPLDILTADELDHIVANYTAINNASITTGSLADKAVTSAKINWSNTIASYTTSEVNTGATWINGKAIYKKTINFGALPNNTAKTVAHGVTGITQVVKVEPLMYSGANAWAVPYVALTAASVEGNNVVLATNTDLSRFSAYVTIYYVKS